MSGDTKTGLPVLRIAVVVLIVGVAGVYAGIDWGSFLDKGTNLFAKSYNEKTLCLSVTNLPPVGMTITWHAGIEDDTIIDGEVSTWEHCEPVKKGDTWLLVAEKMGRSNTTCEGTLMPGGNSLNVRTKGGSTDCTIAGVIP